MKQTLGELAKKLSCHLFGDSSVTVADVSSLQSATSNSLVFVEDLENLGTALGSPAAAIIAGRGFTVANPSKPLLVSDQPRLTFARAAKLLRDPETNRTIHSQATVPASEIGR